MARYYFYILQVYHIIISVARMAKNLPNLILQAFASILPAGDDYLFHRIIGIVDDINLEFYAWMEWCYSSFFLQFL